MIKIIKEYIWNKSWLEPSIERTEANFCILSKILDIYDSVILLPMTICIPLEF